MGLAGSLSGVRTYGERGWPPIGFRGHRLTSAWGCVCATGTWFASLTMIKRISEPLTAIVLGLVLLFSGSELGVNGRLGQSPGTVECIDKIDTNGRPKL